MTAVPGEPSWVTLLIDLAPEHHEVGTAFWCGVTGYGIAPPQGPHDEFVSLLPPVGSPHLCVQRLRDGVGGVHLDLHRPDHPFATLRSPGGVPWCEVTEPVTEVAPAREWPGGHRSVLDQVCLDIPAAHFEAEVAFWAEQTGWELRASPVADTFRSLVRPPGQPVRILFQRVDDDRPHVTAHLDLATDDRPTEVARHRALGAVVVAEHPVWTVLRDPTGAAYCVTDRDPETGVLAPTASS